MKWKRTKTKAYHSLSLNAIHCQSPATQVQYGFDWVSSSHLDNIKPRWINEPSVKVKSSLQLCTPLLKFNTVLLEVRTNTEFLLWESVFFNKKVLYCAAIATVVQYLYGKHLLVYNSPFTQKLLFKWLRVFLLSITS